VRLFGEPADRFDDRKRLGYLAQRAQLGLQAPATVREVVAAGRLL
jgi:zinc transport system ATP-binding protein